MADVVRASIALVCHKSRLLLNSNKLSQTQHSKEKKQGNSKGGGGSGARGECSTVVNTLFACVSRNFTMGKYFGPKVFTFAKRQQAEMAFLLAI